VRGSNCGAIEKKWKRDKLELSHDWSAEMLTELRDYFSLLYSIIFCVWMRFGCIRAFGFGFEWFSLYSPILIVNFLRVVSNSGCRLITPNHINLGVLFDCVILYFRYFLLLWWSLKLVLSQQTLIKLLNTKVKLTGVVLEVPQKNALISYSLI
jgi:hypothetical protein